MPATASATVSQAAETAWSMAPTRSADVRPDPVGGTSDSPTSGPTRIKAPKQVSTAAPGP